MPSNTSDREVDTVLCFDRDSTVSTSFDRHLIYMDYGVRDVDPVPLSWVKWWAHSDPTVDVWASGNQKLKKEAAIPGREESIEVYQRVTGYSYEDQHEVEEYFNYHPGRRDDLMMIRDCYREYDEQPGFIVVDDTDVSDLDAFRYYKPWDFVDAQRAGDTVLSDPTGEKFNDIPVNEKGCRKNLSRYATVIA